MRRYKIFSCILQNGKELLGIARIVKDGEVSHTIVSYLYADSQDEVDTEETGLTEFHRMLDQIRHCSTEHSSILWSY